MPAWKIYDAHPMQAAERMGLTPVAKVVPAERDEPHVQFGKQAYALRRRLARALGAT